MDKPKMWPRLAQQWRRHAGVLAVVFAVLAVALVVVVVVQAVMLRSSGWTVPLGNVAEWVAGVGALAAFGVLFDVARQWRDSQRSQARLVIVESVDPDHLTHWLGGDRNRSQPDVVIHNYSDAPVFNLHVIDQPREGIWVYHHGAIDDGSPTAHPPDVLVLRPDATTSQLSVAGLSESELSTEAVTFSFTDAHGRRWRRTGSRQPVRIVGPSKFAVVKNAR